MRHEGEVLLHPREVPRNWLEAHQESEAEAWVGFHKRSTGKPSITWPESIARLGRLIADSAAGREITPLRRARPKSG